MLLVDRNRSTPEASAATPRSGPILLPLPSSAHAHHHTTPFPSDGVLARGAQKRGPRPPVLFPSSQLLSGPLVFYIYSCLGRRRLLLHHRPSAATP